MRLKKGFTLAEILIVLMVIGVIATMTIPSMMKGVTEAQLKAGYKKAYNTIANFAAMERVAGALPIRGTQENMALMYQSMNSSLSVNQFALFGVNNGTVMQNNADQSGCMTASINTKKTVIGTSSAVADAGAGAEGEDVGTDCQPIQSITTAPVANGGEAIANHVWIITDDNIAYTLMAGGATGTNAGTKQAISSAASDTAAQGLASIVVIVDVNGLSKGPNTLETQGLGTAIDTNASLNTITGDQFKIYIGSDGATAGPRIATVSGRIMADLK